MNLFSLEIPSDYESLLITYEHYYHSFYLEMVRMSNAMLSKHLDLFLSKLVQISKKCNEVNDIRAAIGVVALHSFGYRNFELLTKTFDRLVPQSNLEYVKFTSWCAGQLINHPNLAKARYVQHLFQRSIGWIRHKGQRARPLAACYLIASLSDNDGNSVVAFASHIQSVIWSLISHRSPQIIQTTAYAFSRFTFAITTYGRGEMDSFFHFFIMLCKSLLKYGSPIKKYAAICLIKELILNNSDYFFSDFQFLLDSFLNVMNTSKNTLFLIAAYQSMASLSIVDPKQFVSAVSINLFTIKEEIINEYPDEVVESLCFVIKKVPEFMETKIKELKDISKSLISHPRSAFILLNSILKYFGTKVLPIENDFIQTLMELPFSPEYRDFFISFTNCPNSFALDFPVKLNQRLLNELKTKAPVDAIELIAKLPSNAFVSQSLILSELNEQTTSKNVEVRAAIPKAMFNLCDTCQTIDRNSIIRQLMQYAMYDSSTIVRCSVLRVFLEKANGYKELAQPEYVKFFQVFSNEDSQSARNLAFDLIAKIGKNNPMFFASITRDSLLDYFFTLRHVSSIRQRARITRTMPCLIRASLITISTYTKAFMEIALEQLKNRPMKESFENFLEEDANVAIISGILDSLSLIAPIQPDLISTHANVLIPLLCNFLSENEERKITLSIVNFFEVIFTPPASSLVYRTMAPMIISACSSLLPQTNSRTVRIAILRVLGVIGVIEPNQTPPQRLLKMPSDFDNKITRQFFQPKRDLETSDDYNLVRKEELYMSIVLRELLKILQDDLLKEYYLQTVQCFVTVFSKILMDMLTYFDAFMARFLQILESSTDAELLNYLPLLTKLVINAQNNVTPFLSKLLSLITTRFNDVLAMMIYDLILALLDSVRDNFSHYASELICLLIYLIDTVKTTDEIQSQKILLAFSKICVYANDLLYLIIPQICDAILCEQTLENVRILSFYCLESIAKSTDLFDYLGPIVRAMNVGFEHDNEDTRNSAMRLLYAVIKTQGKRFLNDADPLLNNLKKKQLETFELKKIIAKVNQSSSMNSFQPLIESVPLKKNVFEKPIVFSEDRIVARVFMQSIGTGYNLEHWFRSFIITMISNSPSQAIRTCSTLVTAYYPLAYQLFRTAFLSCWLKIKERGRGQICTTFMQLLSSNENYEAVARELINLFVYLHQFGEKLPVDSNKLIKACLRYGNVSFALKLISEQMDEMQSPDSTLISTLIEAYVQASQWSDALYICDTFQNQFKLVSLENLMKLKKWTVAEEIFKKQLEENHDLNAFRGMAECLASQAKWDQLLSYYSVFKEQMPRELQRDVGEFFANAAYNSRNWDILTDILKYAPKSSIECLILSALNCIHSHNYEKVDDYINQGFELLASKPLATWTGSHGHHAETLLNCQQLMEIHEIMRWMKKENRKEIEGVWQQRLITAPSDFSLWFKFIGAKVPLGIDLSNNLFNFFMLKSKTLDVLLHRNVFNSIFPDFIENEKSNKPNSEKSEVCNSIVLWMTGHKQESIKMIKFVLENGLLHDKDSDQFCRLFFSSSLLEIDDSLEANMLAYRFMKPLINSITLEELKVRIPKYKYSTVKYESNSLPNNVNKSLYVSSSNIVALRKWSEINISLTTLDPDHLTDYVTNAIDSLTKCALVSPSFPDVVQLLNLFFEYADQPAIFNSTAHSCIEKLHPKLILQAAPQLLIQLSHSTPAVADFVHDLVYGILREHFHSFIFSIIVLKSSKNTARAKSAKNLYDEFHVLNPEAYDEVELIRQSLLRAAVTWNETIIQRITDAFDHLSMNRIDRMVASLRSISQFVKNSQCEMHEQVKKKFERQFSQLDNILRNFETTSKPSQKTTKTSFAQLNPSSSSSNSASSLEMAQKVSPLIEWCKMVNSLLTDEVKQVRAIELSAISAQLAKKTHFILAVPGTYVPKKPIIHIEYFVGQFSVYLSKQQPKDVVIVGDNGIFYQYLLKGHEDLRLDERIMQFFSTINSILKKSNIFRGQLIEAMFVMPISISHGLVQWVSGTHTLRAIVESYRNSQGREPLEEYLLLDKYSYMNFDFLQPIQKLQIIEKIFDEVPDTDISNIFWMKAKSSEEWLKRVINFTVSTAMMCITGYTIGLGDRHPSNILVDKNSGQLIHIDFGDCFERAAKRAFLPEVVPFRLTRMIVKAIGITGTNGLFKQSFIDMSALLRENKRVLIMVLAIFVHEPLADPETEDEQGSAIQGRKSKKILSKATTGSVTDKGRVYMLSSGEQDPLSSTEMSNRVNQKLSGTDFDNEIPLTVEEQAIRLIETATDHFNLAMMYSGWCPFW
ncbi:hypothetical protein M9Y10_002797 [Tritrichomonas musculus]|uniref:Serine/threonine-protein kinase TOR n=1 Tax=Tritrichomonas musculus TaxID=1915356 RepID=A0ABR2LCZ5_9EUKA